MPEGKARPSVMPATNVDRWRELLRSGKLLTPSLSEEGFRIEVYLEHLADGSFLYEQRRDSLLTDFELTWLDRAASEERFEAHVDGLVLGEELALAVCQQQAEEGGAGELHAALRVVCWHERKDLLDEVLEKLDGDDEEQVLAVRDALAAELPEAWAENVVGWLADTLLWKQRVAAYVIGYRRLEAGRALLAALPQAALGVLPDLIRALGRLRVNAARTVLYNDYVQHSSETVRAEAALALLRLSEQAALQHIASHERDAAWALPLIGISGSAHHGRMLASAASPASATALGLLGDPVAVEALLSHLENPNLAEAAALGLYLITGHAPVEEAFVPEEMDEDELFEDELEAYRRGELPLRPDGEPYGETVERLAQDPALWRAWWSESGGRFEPGTRYRLGEPCTPLSLVRTLQAERMPRWLRQLAHEELVVRYGIDVPFESDWLVTEQQRAIVGAAQKATEDSATFQPGCWYIARQLLPT
ncbi:MAG: hypothetical protein AAGI91_10385 [Bacteroidota bacterium]